MVEVSKIFVSLLIVALLMPIGLGLLFNNNSCADSLVKFYDSGTVTPFNTFWDGVNKNTITNNHLAKWFGMENNDNSWTNKTLSRIEIYGLQAIPHYPDTTNTTIFNGPIALDILHNGVEILNSYVPSYDSSLIPYDGVGFSSSYLNNTSLPLVFTSPNNPEYVIQDGDIIGITFSSDIQSDDYQIVFYPSNNNNGHDLIVGYDTPYTNNNNAMSMKLYTTQTSNTQCQQLSPLFGIIGTVGIAGILIVFLNNYRRNN